MRQHRYLILLVTLVLFVVLESFGNHRWLTGVGSDAVVTLLALAVFLVVFEGWRERTFALVTAILGLYFSWSHTLAGHGADQQLGPLLHHALMLVFMGFAVAVILGNIFARRAVTGDDVLGTVCGYIIAAGAFANAYAICAIVEPGSFSIAQESQALAGAHTRTAVLNYFSVVTLTTMGYGDVTPVRPPATAIAMLEAVFGQFYIAVVVAQLVGLRMAQAGRDRG